jgi:hypothetical protein
MSGKGCWYHLSVWFCVLCGRTETTRERRTGSKPADPAKRHDYSEGACGDHFC